MFKKSADKQLDIFSSITSILPKRKLALLEKRGSSHKVFQEEVVLKIDEGIFKALYSKDNGRPNSSIRVMIGMMILKEGNGWSDEQLFDSCRFDLRIMLSLGLLDIQDEVPTESSYYLFRKRLVDYKESTGIDLFEEGFKAVTLEQMECHGVSGKMIRMDSKLISSNIAKCSRIELIVKVLERSIKGLGLELSGLKNSFSDAQLKLIGQIITLGSSKLIYQMSSEESKVALEELGTIIMKLQVLGKSTRELDRLFSEQYKVIEENIERTKAEQENSSEKNTPMALEQKRSDQSGQSQTEEEGKEEFESNKMELESIQDQQETRITPNPAKEISSGSMQSPHDPEATYRSKGKGHNKQEVQGYHVNITETCNEEEALNLITDVQTKQANKSESEFMNQAVCVTEEMSQKAQNQGVQEVVTDGGYDSVDNRKEMQNKKDIAWHLAKTKGRNRVYDMSRDGQGNLEVHHRESEKKCEVKYNVKTKKYRIENPKGTKRYFTEEQIDNYIAYAELDAQEMDQRIYCIRSNVESTIHQVFHRVGKRQKIKYRGHHKSHIYALSRAFWVNCKRIFGKVSKTITYVLILMFSSVMENLSSQKSLANIKLNYA